MAKQKAKKKKKKESSVHHTGRLEITRNGTGFVSVEGLTRDVKIRPQHLSNALDGDEVAIELVSSARSSGRLEGIVTKIIRRGHEEFSGTLSCSERFAFLIPDKENMPVDIFIPLANLHEGKDGDKAVVRIVEWPEKSKNPVGEVIRILTHEAANEIAMNGILLEKGFSLHFPEEVLEEAARMNTTISNEEIQKRKDLRDILTFTIDPVDAKDFDDAISFRRLKGGLTEVGVHIADVSHYVTEHSAIDTEASRRTTSVYLPDRVVPMLPEQLSNELCSLRPGEEKLTFSVIFTISKNGKIKDSWIGKTIIRSDRRFTYEEVQEILEGKSGDYEKELHYLHQFAAQLRQERFENGAINFSSRELRFELDQNAVPLAVIIKESKEAHQLIEELMLLANKTVAIYMSSQTYKNKPIAFPYRVHDVPDEEKLRLFTVFALKYGYKFDLSTPQSIARSFNDMLKLIQGRPEQNVLESLGIRTMSKALYTTENIGHYGLGFQHYCHFTSPIRRYPDVLVHRILFGCLENEPVRIKNLEQLCRHCSEKERKAMDAERTAHKYKQAEYMQQFIGEEFEAVVSGVASFGFWAETVAHKCEGMIALSDLRSIDDFEFRERDYALKGLSTGITIRIGDNLTVKVIAVNVEKRQIDYALVTLPHQEELRPKTRKNSKPTSTKTKRSKK